MFLIMSCKTKNILYKNKTNPLLLHQHLDKIIKPLWLNKVFISFINALIAFHKILKIIPHFMVYFRFTYPGFFS